MAFFGLTALGAQNPFESLAKSHAILNIFTLDEFREGWDAVAKGNSELELSQIEAVLHFVYHGPAPEPELILFMEKLGLDRTTPITWPEFATAYEDLVAKIEADEQSLSGRLGSAATYTSYDELCKAKDKGIKLEYGPKEKLVAPLTAVQEFGWNAHESVEKRTIHGKKSCAETIYASELYKSGMYF